MNGSTLKVFLELVALYSLGVFGLYRFVKSAFRSIGNNTDEGEVSLRTAVLSTLSIVVSAVSILGTATVMILGLR